MDVKRSCPSGSTGKKKIPPRVTIFRFVHANYMFNIIFSADTNNLHLNNEGIWALQRVLPGAPQQCSGRTGTNWAALNPDPDTPTSQKSLHSSWCNNLNSASPSTRLPPLEQNRGAWHRRGRPCSGSTRATSMASCGHGAPNQALQREKFPTKQKASQLTYAAVAVYTVRPARTTKTASRSHSAVPRHGLVVPVETGHTAERHTGRWHREHQHF